VAQSRKTKKAGSNLKPFYWALGVVAVLGIAAIAWIVMRNKTAQAADQPVEVPGADDPGKLVTLAKGVTDGKDNAPVKMLVFSDYQCPFCGQFASQVEPVLTSEFVQKGTLQLVYYDFPLGGGHRFSFLAARAARCAGDQGKFWDYHNLLFGKQSEWAYDDNMPTSKFLDYGKEVGVEPKAFETCVNSTKYQDLVSANRVLGEKLMVNSTPTIFINGKRVPPNAGLDIKALRDMINNDAGITTPAAVPPATTAK
jgi:protein-disulfide isomerase